MQVNDINDILDAKLMERHKIQEKRTYLGASQVGEECLRKIQLQYLGYNSDIDSYNCSRSAAQTVRTFDIGHHLENLIAEWMILGGFDLRTRDKNGEQYSFSVADGKLQGHVDGLIYGFPHEIAESLAPLFQQKGLNIRFKDYPWLWECKTLNNKSWNDTAKRGVMASKPQYYAQIQLYLAYMDLEANPCLFTALNKDTSKLYHELIPFDPECAQRYSDRAAQIIKATENNELLPCISNDVSFFKCKMCGFSGRCFGDQGFGGAK